MQEHDASLLDTDPARFPDALKRLGKTKLETAKIRKIVSALLRQREERLPVAKQKEVEAQLEAKRQNVESTGLALAEVWEKVSAKLAPMLREVVEADTAHSDAHLEFSRAVTMAFPLASQFERPRAAPTGKPAYGWRDKVAEMAQPVREPIARAPDPEGEAISEERQERLRADAADYARRDPNGSASHSATPAWPN